MHVNDLFYLLDKKILIMDVHDRMCDASKRQLALSGASIIGPVISATGLIRGVSRHRPDAVIIDVTVVDQDIVRIARKLETLKIPFVFAAISTETEDFVPDGFNLNGDVEELRKITKALFLKPISDEIPSSGSRRQRGSDRERPDE